MRRLREWGFRNALDDRETVPDTRTGPSKERERITPYARNGACSCGYRLPALRFELVTILSPDGCVPVDRHNGDKECLTFTDARSQVVSGWLHVGRRVEPYWRYSWVFPSLSVTGVLSGIVSSLTATLRVDETGAWRRSVSRVTASRYGRAFSSSMVGSSVETCSSSSRSFLWTSRSLLRAYRAQVVEVLRRGQVW
jgi:hypothetical protein